MQDSYYNARRRQAWLESHPIQGTLALTLMINAPMFLLFLVFVSSNILVALPLGISAFCVSGLAGYLYLKRHPTR